MPVDLSNTLVVGISSRALFDLDKENAIFDDGRGLEKYIKYQIEHAEDILVPGNGFGLIRAILAINDRAKDRKIRMAEVVVISRNSPESSLRIFRSIEHHKIDIRRVSLSGGEPNAKYLKAYNVSLFLSANEEDINDAAAAGIPAAMIYTSPTNRNEKVDQIRIAFDGDAVLFSDESERVYQDEGIDAFNLHESRMARVPLKDGPFAPLLKALSRLQNTGVNDKPPVRVALVTARGRVAAERVIRTLGAWKVRVDEAHFMDGVEKTAILDAFQPHIFFDDQRTHCERAAATCVVAKVPVLLRKPVSLSVEELKNVSIIKPMEIF